MSAATCNFTSDHLCKTHCLRQHIPPSRPRLAISAVMRPASISCNLQPRARALTHDPPRTRSHHAIGTSLRPAAMRCYLQFLTHTIVRDTPPLLSSCAATPASCTHRCPLQINIILLMLTDCAACAANRPEHPHRRATESRAQRTRSKSKTNLRDLPHYPPAPIGINCASINCHCLSHRVLLPLQNSAILAPLTVCATWTTHYPERKH